MSTHPVLANVLAWSLQSAIVIAVGGVLPRLFRVRDPGTRHVYWRALLVVCLLLPALQPWQSASLAAPDGSEKVISFALPDLQVSSVGAGPLDRWQAFKAALPVWPEILTAVLVAGALIRLLWLAAGIVRLRRLRVSGEPVMSNEVERDEIERTGIDLRRVPSLRQPVTFGLVRPVVLLPTSFDALSAGAKRAVLEHELWHVRRRDWLWLLLEETVRSILWFHPAINWLISHIQSSREEVVDELTVLATNARRSYLEALLAFADEPSPFPAAPFARRRHLFQRMVLISREAVMSSRRIATSFTAMIVVVVAAAAYGASAFPLRASSPSATARRGADGAPPAAPLALRSRDAIMVRGDQQPPRDPKPGVAKPPSSREAELKKAIASSSPNTAPYLELAKLQEDRGAIAEAEATLTAARTALPNNTPVLNAIAQFYNRQGQFERTIAALEDVAAVDPSDPARHQLIATFYWDKAYKDKSLSPAAALGYIKAGIAATDRALAINADYMEALVYKGILLRMLANTETDATTKQALLADADHLRARAQDLQRARGNAGPPPPPPPPPPIDGSQPPALVDRPQSPALVDGQAPVRIGGAIKPPKKLQHVDAIYPPEAIASKVTGVVIIEAVINAAGHVNGTRVLKSVPLLDQAAVDSVRQWVFEPTLLNDQPVPVIMTVTVNFALQ
jgi:TonB family protein